jgi:DnaJ-class molecular chaperone
MMPWKDPYAILGVSRGAPPSEIKRAYRKLAFSLLPTSATTRMRRAFGRPMRPTKP